jgi:hypothetical protein
MAYILLPIRERNAKCYSDYRGVNLMGVVRKVFVGVIKERLEKELQGKIN